MLHVMTSDVTHILQRIETGDRRASEELLPLVYQELRKLAAQRMIQERPEHTLQATALVHEAYVRLVDQDQVQQWDSRGHFYAAAAEAMRRILIESARAKGRQKRGGDRLRVDVEDFATSTSIASPEQLLELDDALTKLEAQDPAVAELVRLRLYAGLSTPEAAQALGLPRSTAFDYWQFALSWFAVELSQASA
jgi:RNA polymerase sigma factor (TIGR02999 family)